MDDMNTATQKAMQSLVESGKFEAIVAEQLETTVTKVIQNTLNSYSDFGKSLENSVIEGLNLDFSKLGIAGYNDTVLKIVKRKLDAAILAIGTKQIEEDMEELLSSEIPSEITLSKIVEEFIDYYDDDARDNGWQNCTAKVKKEYGSTWVYLGSEPDQEDYRCDYRLYISDRNGVCNVMELQLDGRDIKEKLFIGGLHGFEKLLFQLYACKVKIIVDDIDDTSYPSNSW